MTTSKTAPLHQRRVRARPTQARSRATCDRILRAAGGLLHEIGYEGFNTNLLARRVKCPVSTIYRYFPDKNVIILVLAEEMAREWRGWMTGFDAALDETGDLNSVWARFFDRFFDNIRQQTAGLAIRQALLASPELQKAYQAELDAYASDVTAALQRHIPTITPSAAEAAAFVLITSTLPVLDQASFTPPDLLQARIQALKEMHLAYLQQLQGQQHTTTANGNNPADH